METDSAKQSSAVKKEFRESVLKAAEEYRQEHRLELDATTTDEVEETTTGEIGNPNDEIPVTYLFYELQRTYEVSERIHNVTPVILVANDVPRPDEIDEEASKGCASPWLRLPAPPLQFHLRSCTFREGDGAPFVS